MSGLEIAGAILQALPVAIEALSELKSRKGKEATFIQYNGLVDRLISHLNLEKTLIYQDIAWILREARVLGALDGGDPSEATCIDTLANASNKERIRTYMDLPYLSVDIFEDTARSYGRLLGKLLRTVGHTSPPGTPEEDGVATLIATGGNPHVFRLRGRARIVASKKNIEALIRDLKSTRASLSDCIRSSKPSRGWEAPGYDNATDSTVRDMRTARDCAASLYMAVCEQPACACARQHTAMLRLEEWVRPYSTRSSYGLSKRPPLQFVFNLSVTTNNGEPQEIKVKAAREQVPDASSSQTIIPSICEAIQECSRQGRLLPLELLRLDTLVLADEAPHPPEHSFDSFVSLADILQSAGDERSHILPTAATELVTRIATAVLQLLGTSWCRSPWQSRDIMFPVRSQRPVIHAPHIEQPITTQTTKHPSPMENWHLKAEEEVSKEHLRESLLELAIMMLEILHQKLLVAWAREMNEGDIDHFWDRVRVAKRWLLLSQEKLTGNHVSAIHSCLSQCIDMDLSWTDGFHSTYWGSIIKPLREILLPHTALN